MLHDPGGKALSDAPLHGGNPATVRCDMGLRIFDQKLKLAPVTRRGRAGVLPTVLVPQMGQDDVGTMRAREGGEGVAAARMRQSGREGGEWVTVVHFVGSD